MSDPRWLNSSSGSERSGTTERGREFRESMGKIEGYERDSEERLQKAISIDTVGVLFFNLDGEVRHANEAFERMSGYGRDELRDAGWEDLTASEFMDVTERKVEEIATRGETAPYEKQFIREDGSRWWALCAPKRLSDSGEDAECVEFIIDITDRKQAEKELRESEERKRLALEAGEMGIWELDLRTNESPVRSPRHDEIFGYEEPLEDWSLETFLDHVHPEDRERIEASFEAAVETGDWEFETRIVRADGEYRWIAARGEFFDDEGEPVRAVGTIQDITERKEREQAFEECTTELHEARTQLSTATSAASVGPFEVDLQERVSTGDDYLAETFGMDPERVEAGTSIDEFFAAIHDDDRERVGETFDDAIEETGELDTEYRVWNANDELVWVETRATIEYDAEGEPLKLHGAVSDITERKERERRIERQREQIETLQNRLLETSPTGVLVVDASGEITLANDRAKEIFEPAVGRLVGLSRDELPFDLVDSNGEPMADGRSPSERVMRSGQAVFDAEVGVSQPDGERVWLSVNVAPVSDDGEITEMVVTLDDITERKRTTESLERLNDATRELLDAGAETIRDQTADIARQVLDVELAALWEYNSASGDLKLYDSSTDQDTEIAGLKHPDGFDERAWTAFVTDEMGVDNDLPPAADIAPSERPIRSGVIVPLGRHGVFCAGSTSPNAFDETRVDLAGTIAGTVETVLDRADHERQLAQQNEELTHLNRINAIIREIAQVLVETDTREAINRAVCERLADSDLYEFAWIGQYDTRSNTVVPQEWAGVDSEYLDGLTITTDDSSGGPIGTALRTGELQVTEDILTDPAFAPWREETLAEGVRSCVAIPLVYEGSPYGVLVVYASCPQSDERGHTVLAELGETIAHAIDTVETKRTLQTDSVVELELRIEAPEDVLCRLAGETGCRIEFEGLIPGSDGTATDLLHRTRRVGRGDPDSRSALDRHRGADLSRRPRRGLGVQGPVFRAVAPDGARRAGRRDPLAQYRRRQCEGHYRSPRHHRNPRVHRNSPRGVPRNGTARAP